MCHLRHRKSGLAQRLRLLDTTGHLGPRLPLAVRDRLGAPGGPSCHLHDPNSLINNNQQQLQTEDTSLGKVSNSFIGVN